MDEAAHTAKPTAPDSEPLPEILRAFVQSCTWTFAKTYANTWPHHYIVRGQVDEDQFVQLVQHIRTHGYEACFYSRRITYFDEDGMVYWTMGAPLEDTKVVNRCATEQTYEYRLAHNTLPKPDRKDPL